MRDNRTATDSIHKASGMALTLHPWLQIVTYHRDNSIGVRTMNLADINGAAGTMHGHVTGLTKAGQMFRRAVRLKRVTRFEFAEMVSQTGIYAQDELQGEVLEHHAREFEFLRQRYPDENGDDPLLKVWVPAPKADKEHGPTTAIAADKTVKNSTK